MTEGTRYSSVIGGNTGLLKKWRSTQSLLTKQQFHTRGLVQLANVVMHAWQWDGHMWPAAVNTIVGQSAPTGSNNSRFSGVTDQIIDHVI